MFLLNILLLIAIVVCWVIGGFKNNLIKRIPVPILLGLGIWLNTKSFLCGFLSIGFYQMIRLGYGNYEEGEKNSWLANLLKDHNGWWIRAAWGFLVSLTGALMTIVFCKIFLPYYLLYILLNVVVNFLISRLRFSVIPADILVSLTLAYILFLI